MWFTYYLLVVRRNKPMTKHARNMSLVHKLMVNAQSTTLHQTFQKEARLRWQITYSKCFICCCRKLLPLAWQTIGASAFIFENSIDEMKNLEAELLKKANVIDASMRCFPRLDALDVPEHLYQQFTASNTSSYPGKGMLSVISCKISSVGTINFNIKGNPDEAVLMWLRLPLPGRKPNYEDAYLELHENLRAHLHAWGFNEMEIGRSYYESGIIFTTIIETWLSVQNIYRNLVNYARWSNPFSSIPNVHGVSRTDFSRGGGCNVSGDDILFQCNIPIVVPVQVWGSHDISGGYQITLWSHYVRPYNKWTNHHSSPKH